MPLKYLVKRHLNEKEVNNLDVTAATTIISNSSGSNPSNLGASPPYYPYSVVDDCCPTESAILTVSCLPHTFLLTAVTLIQASITQHPGICKNF